MNLCKNILLAAVLLAFSPFNTHAHTNNNESVGGQPNSLQILVKKDAAGNFETFTTNVKGVNEPLTLGSFLKNSTALMMGKTFGQCSKGQPLYVVAEYDATGTLVTYLIDTDNKKTRFLLKDLIAALPKTLTCGESKKSSPSTIKAERYVQIFLDKDSSGNMQTFIVHPDGRKELLQFSNLFTATAELMKECEPGAEKHRALYITLEKEPAVFSKTVSNQEKTSGLTTVQLDAYGLKEELNLDNLLTAAAETLVLCEKMKNKTLAKAPNQAAIQIKFEKDSSNHLEAYLIDVKGERKPLDLNTLISAAAGIAPCPFTAKEHFITVSYEKDADGTLKAFVLDPDGSKKPFNLIGNLMALAFDLCSDSPVK